MNQSNSKNLDAEPRGFVGREGELQALKMALAHPEPRVAWISGPPGIGKTRLAAEFGRLNRDQLSGGVHSIHASSSREFDLSQSLPVPSLDVQFLLIINDVEPEVHINVAEELAEIRRRYPKVRIIVTSHGRPLPRCAHLHIQLVGLQEYESRVILHEAGTSFARPLVLQQLHDLAKGNPLALNQFMELLRLRGVTPEELLNKLAEFTAPGLVDASGRPLTSAAHEQEEIITDVRAVTDQLLQTLSVKPQLMYDLSPRRFEELVADLLVRLGYEITLTPASKDGGKDIYAAKKDHLGTFLYVVECKKHSPENHVGVGLVRQLNGVVQAEQATAGILATTSFFTRGAKEFQKTISSQISLKDYFGVREWLDTVVKKR